MASPTVLDFDSLLAPISEDSPGGIELKSEQSSTLLYHQIKDAAGASRTSERQLMTARLYGDEAEVSRIAPPKWKTVLDLALDILATKSKDLHVTAWLIEALTRLHGFAGLRDGFRLTSELVERFWDDIHPRPAEDGYEDTISQIAGLNGRDAEGTLLAPIELIPIVAGTSYGPFTSRDYRQAVDLESITDPQRRAQRVAQEDAVTMEQFQRAVAETPPEFFRDLRDDIQQCIQHLAQWDQSLEPRCGEDAYGEPIVVPCSQIRRVLEDCLHRVSSIAQGVLEDANPPEANQPASDGVTAPTETAGRSAIASTGPVASREEAFRTLLLVADFFRRNEPHSPVSYALEQAVRWGRMTLPELMDELISEEGTRDDLFRRVGILKQESSRDD